MNSRTNNVLLFSFITGLERFSYYGMRAIIILFVIDKFEFSSSDAIGYSSNFSLVALLLLFPAGLISDFILNQKKGYLLGGIISTIGYFLLITEQLHFIVAGLFFIMTGVGFIKVNIMVLIGRLFKKHERERDFGFLVSHFGVNLGGFLAAFYVGMLAEYYGYKYGFMVVAFASIVHNLIFYFTKDRLELIEGNDQNILSEDGAEKILDSEFTLVNKKENYPYSLLLIGILLFSNILYWSTSDISLTLFRKTINGLDEFQLFGWELYRSIVYGLDSYLYIPVLLLIIISWQLLSKISTWYKLAIALLLMAFGSILIPILVNKIIPSGELSYILFPFFLFAIGEIILGTFVYSYITRLSDVRYSSSIIGGFILLAGLSLRIFEYLKVYNNGFTFGYVLVFLCVVTGIWFFINKNAFLKKSGGLD